MLGVEATGQHGPITAESGRNDPDLEIRPWSWNIYVRQYFENEGC